VTLSTFDISIILHLRIFHAVDWYPTLLSAAGVKPKGKLSYKHNIESNIPPTSYPIICHFSVISCLWVTVMIKLGIYEMYIRVYIWSK